MAVPGDGEGAAHVFHLYVARHERADHLVEALTEAGVGARAYYRRPIHEQPAMERYASGGLDLPGTAEAARTNFALPMGTALAPAAVEQVVEACAAALG